MRKVRLYLTMMGMLLLSTCFSVAQNKTQSTTNTETSKVQKKSTQQLLKETYRNQNRRDELVFQAWVTDPDPTGTNVRQTPNGVVMRILMPNEHSYMVSVLEEWNGWFRIDNPIQVLDTEEDLYCDGEMPTLWIHSSLLGCTTRVDVQLLKEPSSSAPVSIRIGADVVVQPMAIKGQWVKVKHTNSRNKTFTGWVKASSLCGNPVSLCM